ncbi:MAG: DUF362 domain-containing protein [cyanobacterium endosymbiont of Rhopalodia sterrenbergii]
MIINLPKVKSHFQFTLALGVKNLFGCVPGKIKAWWYMNTGKNIKRFWEKLVETARTINSDSTVVNGTISHEGNEPVDSKPSLLEILGASADVFILD